jgi:MYXO-CTERM domain-containing protein
VWSVKTFAAAALLASAAGAAVVAPLRAHAAPCGVPDLADMVPPDGATGVPLNAKLGAHYLASADYLGEDVVLVHPDGREQVLDARFDPTEVLLSVTPTEPLVAGGAYVVRWPALRALNAATPGIGGQAHFTAGTKDDTESPSFAGVTQVHWDLERVQNDCTEELEERYVFDIALGDVSDDGGRDGLTLLVFQTSGSGAMAMTVPVSTRAIPAAGAAAQVKLPTRDSIGHVCFAALVRDTADLVSQSGAAEACVDTVAPPFFRGCSVAGPAPGAAPAITLGALAVLALLARRRKT